MAFIADTPALFSLYRTLGTKNLLWRIFVHFMLRILKMMQTDFYGGPAANRVFFLRIIGKNTSTWLPRQSNFSHAVMFRQILLTQSACLCGVKCSEQFSTSLVMVSIYNSERKFAVQAVNPYSLKYTIFDHPQFTLDSTFKSRLGTVKTLVAISNGVEVIQQFHIILSSWHKLSPTYMKAVTVISFSNCEILTELQNGKLLHLGTNKYCIRICGIQFILLKFIFTMNVKIYIIQ